MLVTTNQSCESGGFGELGCQAGGGHGCDALLPPPSSRSVQPEQKRPRPLGSGPAAVSDEPSRLRRVFCFTPTRFHPGRLYPRRSAKGLAGRRTHTRRAGTADLAGLPWRDTGPRAGAACLPVLGLRHAAAIRMSARREASARLADRHRDHAVRRDRRFAPGCRSRIRLPSRVSRARP